MRQRRLLVKIHSAAFYFSHISRDVNEIAKRFGVSVDAIYKWAKTSEWEFALDVFNYAGEREFARRPRRDTQRDAGEVFENARDAYLKAMDAGVPVRKIATIVAKSLGLKRQRVYQWAKRYGWREGYDRSSNRQEKVSNLTGSLPYLTERDDPNTEESNERDKTAK